MLEIDPKIRFLVSVPDGRPEEASPFQGFAMSLCQNSWFLRFAHFLPSDIFEFTPEHKSPRLAARMAGQLPVSWYGQSPRALKAQLFPAQVPFMIVALQENETADQYQEWLKQCPAPITLIAKDGGHIPYAELTYERFQQRLLEVCGELRPHANLTGVEEAEVAIRSWVVPEGRALPYDVGGHGTITPNLAVLRSCGFSEMGQEPFRAIHDEKAYIDQIVQTSNSIFDERNSNPPSVLNLIWPRQPDLNIYLPATYDLKSVLSLRSELTARTRRQISLGLRMLERQNGYSYDAKTAAQFEALAGVTSEELKTGAKPQSNPIMRIRQLELHLGTEMVACLAASEISAVVRPPNRLNRTRGLIRQFAQHYRSDKQQMFKRAELFRGVQREIANGFPKELQQLIERSVDGIRVISDAHIEWLDVRGIPLGLRHNVSRIPVTPGNLFVDILSDMPQIQVRPEDFQEVLVVCGLNDTDVIAEQFDIAFSIFGKHWRDKLKLTLVKAKSRTELVQAINAFHGVLMIFDGHGSHKSNEPGFLWLCDEAVDVWSLRDEVLRAPPIVILSACDTHAADRNHATVANGFLALGSRSVLGSVFPLHASQAAIFAARLLYRVSDYIPAAIDMLGRSITWLEVVSGMLRRQAITDILHHLESIGLVKDEDSLELSHQIQRIADSGVTDPFSRVRQNLIDYGVPEDQIDEETHRALSISSTISYLHLGRPETILINSEKKLKEISDAIEGVDEGKIT